MQMRWLRRITGRPYVKGALHTPRIGGTAGAWRSVPAGYHANLATVVGYLVKGASAAAAQAYGLSRTEPGGPVIGKRCATSENIGRAARTRRVSERNAQG